MEQLRKNWVIILSLIGIVIAWTNLKADIKQNTEDVTDIEVKNLAIELKIDNYQNQVSEVSGDIKAIKESLTFIRDKIK